MQLNEVIYNNKAGIKLEVNAILKIYPIKLFFFILIMKHVSFKIIA
jgi:hypothetical protein